MRHRRDRSRSRNAGILVLLSLLLGCATDAVSADELGRLERVLALKAGGQVADVGAGDGRWSVKLAGLVGAQGRVWATEVEQRKVDEIEERAQRDRSSRITAVLGDQRRTGLAEGCCDAVLLRMVYHHFRNPESMRADLYRALRPGGRIAVVETAPQKSWGDVDGEIDRGGHGIGIDELLEEMTASGFELVDRFDSWKGPHGDPYCLVFRRP